MISIDGCWNPAFIVDVQLRRNYDKSLFNLSMFKCYTCSLSTKKTNFKSLVISCSLSKKGSNQKKIIKTCTMCTCTQWPKTSHLIFKVIFKAFKRKPTMYKRWSSSLNFTLCKCIQNIYFTCFNFALKRKSLKKSRT